MIIYIRAFRTTNLSAKAIHLGDKLFENQNNLEPIKSFNHWEVGYEDKTSGSISKGTITRDFLPYLASVKCEYKEWEFEITNNEWANFKSYLNTAENKPYEFAIFALYPLSLIFGKWLGSTTMGKLFCVEHVIRALNATGRFNLPFNLWPTELQRELNKL